MSKLEKTAEDLAREREEIALEREKLALERERILRRWLRHPTAFVEDFIFSLVGKLLSGLGCLIVFGFLAGGISRLIEWLSGFAIFG